MTDAHDDTTDASKEPSNDTTRRQFLGAAAAVTTLPAVASTTTTATSDGGGVEADETSGAETVFASFATDTRDFDATYQTYQQLDDSPHVAGIELGTSFGCVAFDLTAAQARDVIQDLQAALVEVEH